MPKTPPDTSTGQGLSADKSGNNTGARTPQNEAPTHTAARDSADTPADARPAQAKPEAKPQAKFQGGIAAFVSSLANVLLAGALLARALRAKDIAHTQANALAATAVPSVDAGAQGFSKRQYAVVLKPHFSLTPYTKWGLFAGLGLVMAFASLRFWAIGAWPVLFFVWIDFLAVWLAFYIVRSRARIRDRVAIRDGVLYLERIMGRQIVAQTQLEPYWTRAHYSPPTPQTSARLTIGSHGQHHTLGTFLADYEKADASQAINAMLDHWRTTPAYTLSQTLAGPLANTAPEDIKPEDTSAAESPPRQ